MKLSIKTQKIIAREVLIFISAAALIGLIYVSMEISNAYYESRINTLKKQERIAEKAINEFEVQYSKEMLKEIDISKRPSKIDISGVPAYEEKSASLGAYDLKITDEEEAEVVLPEGATLKKKAPTEPSGTEQPNGVLKLDSEAPTHIKLDSITKEYDLLKKEQTKFYLKKIRDYKKTAYLGTLTIILSIIIYPLRIFLWLIMWSIKTLRSKE